MGRPDRYVIGEEIAAGGMATVHLGAMVGDAGFARMVAIKRLHPQFARDPEFSAMLLDEGRLAGRLGHVNVIGALDVVVSEKDVFIVMEYVHGEPLNRLLRTMKRRKERIPPRMAAAIVTGALRGLHAAHEARDAFGRLLGVVHRDVSPQNIMLGADGIVRVLDFGIAKAAGHTHATQAGEIKGKLAYMPPEQLRAEELDRRTDVYAAGVVLWETLVGGRLFAGVDQAPNIAAILHPKVDPPSARAPELGDAYDEVTLRALSADRAQRPATALAMAEALEACGPVATPTEFAAWLETVSGDELAASAKRLSAAEQELTRKVHDSLQQLDESEDTITDVADLSLGSELPLEHTTERLAARGTIGETAILPPHTIVTDAPSLAPTPLVTEAPSEASERAAERPHRTIFAGVVIAATSALVTLLLVGGMRSALPVEPAQPAGASNAIASTAEPSSAVPPPTGDQVIAPPPASASASASGHAPRRPPVDASCTPPFTVDPYGHKHFKRACLR